LDREASDRENPKKQETTPGPGQDGTAEKYKQRIDAYFSSFIAGHCLSACWI
jgi:hypothetical protein